MLTGISQPVIMTGMMVMGLLRLPIATFSNQKYIMYIKTIFDILIYKIILRIIYNSTITLAV